MHQYNYSTITMYGATPGPNQALAGKLIIFIVKYSTLLAILRL